MDVYRFAGKNPEDMNPTWGKLAPADLATAAVNTVKLAPTSITVVDMQADRPGRRAFQ